MKKIIVYLTSMLFVLALGTLASASSNGITDFTGGAYDRFDIGPVAASHSMEGANAGGFRAADKELYNGVTDFSGKSHDTFEINTVPGKSVEGNSAGGMRQGHVTDNGITDFNGTTHDRGEIGG